MKYLLSIIFLFVISFTNAQVLDSIASKTKQVVTTTKEAVKDGVAVVDTSSNFKHIYTDIKTGITALAQGLKVGVEHVYMVLVKQQIVYAIVYLIVELFALFFIVNWINGYKDTTQKWEDDDNITGLGIIKLIQIVIGGIMLGVFLYHIDTIIMGFVNPEYGAIQQIISVVKTGDLETCKTCNN